MNTYLNGTLIILDWAKESDSFQSAGFLHNAHLKRAKLRATSYVGLDGERMALFINTGNLISAKLDLSLNISHVYICNHLIQVRDLRDLIDIGDTTIGHRIIVDCVPVPHIDPRFALIVGPRPAI